MSNPSLRSHWLYRVSYALLGLGVILAGGGHQIHFGFMGRDRIGNLPVSPSKSY